jgi:hypothetical protein
VQRTLRKVIVEPEQNHPLMTNTAPDWTTDFEAHLEDELKKWISFKLPTSAAMCLKLLPALPSFGVPNWKTLSDFDRARAVKKYFATILPADTGRSDIEALRWLCRQQGDGTAEHRRKKANDALKDDGSASHRGFYATHEPRLRRLLVDLIGEHNSQRIKALGPSETASDLVQSQADGTRADEHLPLLVLARKAAEHPHVSSSGLIAIPLEVDFALQRRLINQNEAGAPEIEGPGVPTTVLDLLAAPEDRLPARLILLEADGGAGKSSLLRSIEIRLFENVANQIVRHGDGLIPVRLELPVVSPDGSSVSLTQAIEETLGPLAFDHLRATGGPGGPRLLLLVDGADQDSGWMAVAREIEAILEEAWIGSVMVTGRPGSTWALAKTHGMAAQSRDREPEPFGAIPVTLHPMDFSEVVSLARAFFAKQSIDLKEQDALAGRACRALRFMDPQIDHWLSTDGYSLQEAVNDFRRDKAYFADMVWFLYLDRSITPLMVLLTCWAVEHGGSQAAIETDIDLLSEVADRWLVREAQRLAKKRLNHEPPAETMADILQRLTELIAWHVATSDAWVVTQDDLMEFIRTNPVAGVDGVGLALWWGRLRDCGLFDSTSGGLVFIHALIADFMCVQFWSRRGSGPDKFAAARELWEMLFDAVDTVDPLDVSEWSPVGERYEDSASGYRGLSWIQDPLPLSARRVLHLLRCWLLLEKRRNIVSARRSLTECIRQTREREVAKVDVRPQDGAEEFAKASALAGAMCRLAVETSLVVDEVIELARTRLRPWHTARDDLEIRTEIVDEMMDGLDDKLPQSRWRTIRHLHEEAWLQKVRDEVENGPSPEQAWDRAPVASEYTVDAVADAAALIDLLGDDEEDPYLVAAVVKRKLPLNRSDELPMLLKRPGHWKQITKYRIEALSDRDVELPGLTQRLTDCEPLDLLLVESSTIRSWLIGCMLPPVCSCPPPESSFWESSRPGLAGLRDELLSILSVAGLSRNNLLSFVSDQTGHLGDARPDSADALAIAAKGARVSSAAAPDVAAIQQRVVANAEFPWVTRVWGAMLIEDVAPFDDLFAALTLGADEDPVAALDKAPWWTKGGPLPLLHPRWRPLYPRRYTLTAQTAREEFLGSRGFANSYEGQLSLAAKKFVQAVDDGTRNQMRRALGTLRRIRHESQNPNHMETDAFDRAIAIAGQHRPKWIDDWLDQATRDHFASTYRDPGERWAAQAAIEWQERALRDPWENWLR